MGNYLERPVLDLDTEQGSNDYLSYGCSSVQGWRCTQEDAHSATLDLTDGLSFFAVYDGHGGKEVAQYCASALPSQFLSEAAFTARDNISQALYDAFLNVDSSLLTPAVKRQLEQLAEPKAENKTSSENGDCELKSQKGPGQKARLVRGRRRHRRKKSNRESDILGVLDSESKQLIVDEVARLVAEMEVKHCLESLLSTLDANTDATNRVGDKETKADVPYQSCPANRTESQLDLVPSKEDPNETSESLNNKKRPSSDIHDAPSSSASPSATSPDVQQANPPVEVTSPAKGQTEESFRHEKNLLPLTRTTGEGAKKPRRESRDRRPASGPDEAVANRPSEDKKDEAAVPEDEPLLTADTIPEGSTVDISPIVLFAESAEQQSVGEDEDNDENDAALPIELTEPVVDNDDDNEAGDEPDDYEMGAAQKELIMSELRTFRLLRELGPIRVIRPQKRNPGMNSGCTAIVAVVTRSNKLIVANAGDSRAVLCRGGEAIPLSKDHSPDVQEERERIEKAGHEITADGRVDGGLNLSRSLGDHTYKDNVKLPPESQAITCKPDICEMQILPEDEFMVLACDGIWNCKSNQEVCDMIRSRMGSNSLGGICEEICSLCIAPSTDGDGTGCDNMTLMIVTFRPYTYGKVSKNDYGSKKEEPAGVSNKTDVDGEGPATETTLAQPNNHAESEDGGSIAPS